MNKSERVVVARDADGVIIGWNSGAEHLFGYGAAEVLGLSIRRLIPAEDLEREDALLARLEHGERVGPIVVDHMHKDGHRIAVKVAIGIASDPQGKRAVVTEVADPDAAQTEVRQIPGRSRSRRRGRIKSVETKLASLPHAVILIDGNGRIVGANASAERMFRRPRGDLHGRRVNELSDEFVAEDYMAAAHTQVRARPKRRELTAIRSDGMKFPMRAVFSAVSVGRETFTLATVSDLTARRTNEAATNERRHLFRQMVESLTDLIWTCSPDGAADYFSPHWVTFTGVPADQQVGSGWMSQVHAEDREALAADWKRTLDNCAAFKGEFRVRRQDGVYRWCTASAVPVRNLAGAVVRWFCACTDVHDIRETHRALTAERDRFARLVDLAPGAIYAFRLEPDGRTSYPFVSAGIRELFGLSAEEMERDDARSLIPSEDLPRLTRAIGRSARDLTPFHHEWRIRHPLKGMRWIEGRSVPTREPDGSTLWYGISIDVTERKRSEEALALSQARLQAAVTAGGIGTWIWDVVEDRVSWDDNMLKMWGREAHEVNGLSNDVAMSFINSEDRAHIERVLAALPAEKQDELVLEYRSIRRDGALQWIAAHGRIERAADGSVVRIIGACQDITARKRAEEVQRQSQKVEALGTLAGGIAHDFNNILLAIGGNAKLAMEDSEPNHPAQRSLREIARASARATNLVQRILAFSRQTEPRRELIQLRPAIEEALRLLRSTLPAMIEIRTEMTSAVPSVNADSTQIHQVMMNLITNSAHAIGERSGVVTVKLDAVESGPGNGVLPDALAPGRYVRISISDTGCGMDRAVLDRIFDPFFTTKPAGHGTGLGLSVVHGIVRSHQGGIAVDSKPGAGARFNLYFPAAGNGELPAMARPPEPAMGNGQRIMYIDDEDSVVYLATRQLQRLGYMVIGFTDPGKALQAFSANPGSFDVVVTDVSMPGMSGFHLAHAILKLRADMPVLMTSGYVRPQDRDAAAQLGIREFIPKPHTLEGLGHALEKLFGAKAGHDG